MRLLAVLLFLGFAFCAQAQEVSYNGNVYKVKGKKILLEGADVTTVLSQENQTGIWNAFNEQEALIKATQEAEKVKKAAEKEKKKIEKAEKKAEKQAENEKKKIEKEKKKAEKEKEKAKKEAEKEKKELAKEKKELAKKEKNAQKAKDKFNNANDNYEDNLAKYEKLKSKGKLSPNAEDKWLKKIDGLKQNIEKARRRL